MRYPPCDDLVGRVIERGKAKVRKIEEGQKFFFFVVVCSRFDKKYEMVGVLVKDNSGFWAV